MSASRQDRKRSRPQSEDARPAANGNTGAEAGSLPSRKKAKVEERRSIFVRSLPPDATSETLTDFFSEHFPVKHATVVVDQKTKESRGFGFVTFADAEDAAEAKKSLDKKKWNGRLIRIDVAEPRHRSDGAGETPRAKPEKPEFQNAPKLIIRNLPWSIKTSEQLTNLFRSFGKVKFADLPQNKGKLKGFGFVTIRGKKNAEKALEAINGKEIDGRTLAVDWAVDKETWENNRKEDAGAEKSKSSSEEDEDDETSDEDDEEDEDDDAVDDEEGGAPTRDDELQNDLDNFFKNHMQNLEDESEDDADEDKKKEEEEEAARPPRPLMTDNSATVFVRNLPYTTTDENLKAFFGHFGKVRYARVVVDKVTEKPAGTGFVCFFDASDAKQCIISAPRPNKDAATTKHSILTDENADPDGKYTLDGRLLQVAQAVNKATAEHLASDSLEKRHEKDKRRLFLLGEGYIRKETPLYDMLTPMEIQMRQASAAQRRKMVQSNPSLHVSLTRIALRNMPRNIGAKELKELARKAIVGFAKDVKEGKRQPLSKEENARDGKDAREKERERKQKGKGIVKQAKVVFESTQGSKVPEKSGAGKSRGYGFIEYTSHHWALMGLRYLNGLQVEGDNGRKQRLIAEFAIENAQVVQRRRANEAKATQPAKTDSREKKEKGGKKDGEADTGIGGLKRNSKVRGKRGQKVADSHEQKASGDDKPADPKEALKQTLITRKKLMRKKKAKSRGTN
ncbi:RNA-binding protein [Paramyrothecium foliicola]|nr:RNA-binding protein [Paramyrothecium foliicola]